MAFIREQIAAQKGPMHVLRRGLHSHRIAPFRIERARAQQRFLGSAAAVRGEHYQALDVGGVQAACGWHCCGEEAQWALDAIRQDGDVADPLRRAVGGVCRGGGC